MKIHSMLLGICLILSACSPDTIVTTTITSPTPVFTPVVNSTTTNPTSPCQTSNCQSTCPTGTCTGTNPNLGGTPQRAPDISVFSADSFRLSHWNNGTLIRWDVSDFNANVRIDPYPGNVAAVGNAFVFPQQTTTYTLTARNNFGAVQRQLTIIVLPAPAD